MGEEMFGRWWRGSQVAPWVSRRGGAALETLERGSQTGLAVGGWILGIWAMGSISGRAVGVCTIPRRGLAEGWYLLYSFRVQHKYNSGGRLNHTQHTRDKRCEAQAKQERI